MRMRIFKFVEKKKKLFPLRCNINTARTGNVHNTTVVVLWSIPHAILLPW